MNTQKLILFLGLLLSSSSITFAQQDPHFTQYFDNALFVNPAYAGSTKMLSATAIHREQWVGFEGRPTSTTFSVHSPLSYESVGVGFTAVRDVLGPLKQTMFYGDFSYSLRFKKSRSLAFGLKAGLNLINMETATLNTTQESDPHLMTNTLNKVNPNFGFGIYYHSPKLFFGLSTPKIIEQSYDGSAKNSEKRHYFAIVGGIIKMNTSWKLRPTAQVKMTTGAPISIDLSVAAIHRDQLYLGAMYRFGAAYGIFVQYQISQQFRVGLATDFGTQALRNYNNGTFELMLSYDFSFNKEGVRSPRYF
jgi:type IX secretion system PorP/SprF family membrane protein